MSANIVRSLRFKFGGEQWSPLKEYNVRRLNLNKDNWTATADSTYTYAIADMLIGPNTFIEITQAADITEDECYAMKNASFHIKEQYHNTIIIEANIKPAINIPIQLCISVEPTAYPIIFGVKKASQTSADGWSLDWCDADGDTISLTANDFKSHKAYNSNGYDTGFADYTDTLGNVFCTIPIAYWWRGYIDGVWTMLISDKSGTFGGKTFAPHKAVFKTTTSLLDNIYYSKYRGTYDSATSKVKSTSSNKDGTVGMTYANYRLGCLNNGLNNYSLGSYQNYIEIALREVIEKKTFNIQPSSHNASEADCIYRGIERWMYSGTSTSEYLDGISITDNVLYVFDDTGSGNFSNTTITVPTGYPSKLASSSLLDFLFVPEECDVISKAMVAENCNNVNSGNKCVLTSSCSSPFAAANLNSNAITDTSKISGRLVLKQ